MITRFAPSPTGWLHLGHAYSAWLAWERAQKVGGDFRLRFEDIDHTRVRENYYAGIEEDLQWLGIRWKEPPIRQLDRLSFYREAFYRLQAMGLLYPCFCTRRELVESAPQQGDGAVSYRGTCRKLPQEERDRRLRAGRDCSWRMDMERAGSEVGGLLFEDLRFGVTKVQPSILGDPVLARKDIATSYHLAVVVDDAAQGVTEVTRGEDLLTSTHVHRVLQELLQLPEPSYFHHKLVVDQGGKRLAKRDDGLALRTLREEGRSAPEVIGLAQESLSERD